MVASTSAGQPSNVTQFSRPATYAAPQSGSNILLPGHVPTTGGGSGDGGSYVERLIVVEQKVSRIELELQKVTGFVDDVKSWKGFCAVAAFVLALAAGVLAVYSEIGDRFDTQTGRIDTLVGSFAEAVYSNQSRINSLEDKFLDVPSQLAAQQSSLTAIQESVNALTLGGAEQAPQQ